ncbi:MAG: hypothetical protein LPK02_13495 [Rhodobacterales bacterium]|nr:hypothetical protein [Rhodobacterales bacterium]MDX5414047.1 hypothetical protein [Rhodobacterales bacterium]
MPSRPSSPKIPGDTTPGAKAAPVKTAKVLRPDPVEEAKPLDEVEGQAILPTDPPVVTALDDDEGGADAIDPDTGRPYENKDPGAATPAAGRKGGNDEG